MAALNVASVSDALQKIFDTRIVNTLNRSATLLRVLPTRPAEGQNIQWDARVGPVVSSGSGYALADGANAATANSTTTIPAVLQYCTMAETFGITGRAAAIAAASGRPDALANLFENELMDAVQRVTKGISLEMFSAPGTGDRITGMLGSGLAVDDRGTYAGIDRSTYTTWKSTRNHNSGTARDVSLKLLRTVVRDISIASGTRPNLIVVSPVQFDKIGELFDDRRRYGQDVREVRIGERMISLDGGFQALSFDNIPIVPDIDCPAGKAVFLNTAFVGFRQLNGASQQRIYQILAETGLAGKPQENRLGQIEDGAVPLTAQIVPLAVNGDTYNFQVKLYLQFQNRNPVTCGVLEDLTTT